MRKLLVVFLVLTLLFIISSCKHTPTYEEMYETLLEENSELEEKYYEAAGRVDDLEHILSRINDSYVSASCYYDETDLDVSEDVAYDSIMKIGDLLNEAGY